MNKPHLPMVVRGPYFTGNHRYRIQKRLFRSDLVVLQLEYIESIERLQPPQESEAPLKSPRSHWCDALPDQLLNNGMKFPVHKLPGS